MMILIMIMMVKNLTWTTETSKCIYLLFVYILNPFFKMASSSSSQQGEKRKFDDRYDTESTLEERLRAASTLQARSEPRFPQPFLERMRALGVPLQDAIALTSIDKQEGMGRDYLLQAHATLSLNKLWAQVERDARSMANGPAKDQFVQARALRAARDYIAKYKPFHVYLSINNAQEFANPLTQFATILQLRFSEADAKLFFIDQKTKWPPKLNKLEILSGAIDFKNAVWPSTIKTLLIYAEFAELASFPPMLTNLFWQLDDVKTVLTARFPDTLEYIELAGFASFDEPIRSLNIRWPPQLKTLVLHDSMADFDQYVFPETVETLVLSSGQSEGLDTVVWPPNLKHLKIEQIAETETIDPHVRQLAPLPASLETFWWVLDGIDVDQFPDIRANDFDAMLNGLPNLKAVLFQSQQRFDLQRRPRFKIYIDAQVYPRQTFSNIPAQYFVNVGLSRQDWAQLFPKIDLY